MSIDVSALTPQEQVTAIYVAYYDRAPDPAGLQFWVSKITSGEMTLTDVANAFANAAETKAKYAYFEAPDVAGVATFINEIYQNLFNRAPDAEGATFWADQLTSGAVAAGEFILAVLAGAQDVEGGAQDKSVIENKIDVAFDWTQSALDEGVGTSGNPIAEEVDGKLEVLDQDAFDSATSILDGVTGDAASVDAAKAATDAFFSAVEPFNLTTAADAFTGTDADEVFNAPLDLAIDGLVGAQTLQGPDVLEGGEGTDTLNAELNNTGTTQNPTISGIEIYNLTAFSGLLGGDVTLDLNRATGYQQLWNRDSRVDLDIFNVGEVAILGMDNVRDGAAYNVDYDNIAVAEQTVVAMMTGSDTQDAELDIDGVDGVIGTMNLIVSGGVYLDLDDDAADMQNLNIEGSGMLDLWGEDRFGNLQTLNSQGYTGDLWLNVSGSTVLSSVLTGPGDDTVIVDNNAVDGGLAVDMGEGENILSVNDADGSGDINALDFTGGIQHVQTLELRDDILLTGDATLDLDGFDENLTAVNFDNLDGDGFVFGFANAPEVLVTNFAENLEDVDLDTGNIVDLTVNVAGGVADIDSLNGPSLEMLAVNQTSGGQIWLDIASNATHDVSALQMLSVTGAGDADVELDATDADADFDALTTVGVEAANAELVMNGAMGTPFVAGVQQQQSFTVNVTGAGGFPNSTSAGNVAFTSASIPGGVQTIGYGLNGPFFLGFDGDARHDESAADDLAAGISGIAGLSGDDVGLTNQFIVTWDEFGSFDPLVWQPLLSGGTTGTLDSVIDNGIITAGVEQVEMVPGEGFDGLETVTVNATNGDADVELMDVYGLFTLDVDATDDAWVDLTNTNVTSAIVTAGDEADVDVAGDTIGNWSLVDLTVEANTATVDMDDDLASFTTLDVSGVATEVDVDTSGAIFDVDPGAFITYLIGETSDGVDGTADVQFTGNDAREVYDFVGGDIGEVELTDFDWSLDITDPGDRLDLSGFAANAGQLVFTDNGADIIITDLNGGLGDFGGAITIVGATGFADEIASFNIIYG
jgi:hypothetical protein